VTKSNAQEWRSYYDENRSNPQAKPPKTRLMDLPDLLKAIRRPNSAGDSSNAIGITISDAELKWLCDFHRDIRNQFVHFEPQSWSIEVSGIPKIAQLVVRIITEIIQSGYAFRNQDSIRHKEMQRSLQSLESITWP
jgi:hypothetical protein